MDDYSESALISEAVILIRINQLYSEGMGRQALYDATRGIWRVGERRYKADFAFAVYQGMVKEVYRIENWVPAGTTLDRPDLDEFDLSTRWEFVGKIAEESIRQKYLGKSVRSYLGRSQNPILYVNC